MTSKSEVPATPTKPVKEYSVQHRGKVVKFKSLGENLIKCTIPDHLPQERLESIKGVINAERGVKRDSAQIAPSGDIHFELNLRHTSFENFTKALAKSIIDKVEDDRLRTRPGSLPSRQKSKKRDYRNQPNSARGKAKPVLI